MKNERMNTTATKPFCIGTLLSKFNANFEVKKTQIA